MPSRILITGATGFIGRALAARVQPAECDLLVRRPLPRDLAAFNAIHADLSDSDALSALGAKQRWQTIVHIAALMPGGQAGETWADFVDAHLRGLGALAKLLADDGHFIFVSSIDVYGAPVTLPMTEDHTTTPASFYGAAKLAAEHALRIMLKDRLCTLRLTQVYGPGDRPIKVLPIWMAKARAGEAPTIRGDGDDQRDWLHVSDAAAAMVCARQRRVSGIFNIGTGRPTCLRDAANLICKIAGLKSGPTFLPRTAPRVDSFVDISRARTMLGYDPKMKLSDGLAAWWQDESKNV